MTVSGHFLTSLQSIVGRVVDPLQRAVVSACSVRAGDPKALKVMPNTIEIGGTARACSPAVRDQLEAEIERLATGTATMFGVQSSYRYIRRIPPVLNDPTTTDDALKAARDIRDDGARTAFPPSTAGDDFAFFCADVQGAYLWLGNGPAVDGALHHNTAYDFNDAAIATGVGFWVRLVQRQLEAG